MLLSVQYLSCATDRAQSSDIVLSAIHSPGPSTDGAEIEESSGGGSGSSSSGGGGGGRRRRRRRGRSNNNSSSSRGGLGRWVDDYLRQPAGLVIPARRVAREFHMQIHAALAAGHHSGVHAELQLARPVVPARRVLLVVLLLEKAKMRAYAKLNQGRRRDQRRRPQRQRQKTRPRQRERERMTPGGNDDDDDAAAFRTRLAERLRLTARCSPRWCRGSTGPGA